MTYGTSHLLIGVCVCVGGGGGRGGGVGGYFQGEGQEKILLCKGGGSLHEKLKYRGDVFCQLNLISKKRPQCKNAQKMQKIIEH